MYFSQLDLLRFRYILSVIPENVSVVIIAFVAPCNVDFDTSFADQVSMGTSITVNGITRLKYDIALLKQRMQPPKILLSLMDTPTIHWNIVNAEIFALNLEALIDDLGINGIDIDSESAMDADDYVSTFIQLIQTLRKVLGPFHIQHMVQHFKIKIYYL